MKKIILLFILTISYLSSYTLAQTLSQQEKDSIITDLYSTNWATVEYAKDGIIFFKIYEALPVLQSEIWNKNNYLRLSFVQTMLGLEFESTINYALTLFDSLNENIYSEYDTIIMKLDLVQLLFELDDYSKIDYLKYHTDPIQDKFYTFQIIFLWRYLLDVPEFEQMAKKYLIEFFNESMDGDNRSLALYWLGIKHKSEIAPMVINRFRLEDDFSVKWTILKEYMPLGDFTVISELLKESLKSETDETLRRAILYYLLDSLRIPSNYYWVKTWLDDESSFTRMKRIAKVYERVFPGKPFIRSTSTSVMEIIDSTQSYLIQCHNYGWIENTEFVNELQSIIQSVQSKLQVGDSVACAEQVKSFQDLVDNVYKDSLNADLRFVTIEGWKFLYWNAQYILDRLPHIDAYKKE